jgi:hypothetical protein
MLTVKLEGIEEARRMFDPKVVNRAAYQAINETVRGVRTATGKEIRKEWNVKAGDLNKKLRAVKMARYGDLEGIVAAQSGSFSLSYFGAKSYKGNTVQTRTSGRRMKRASGKGGVYVKIKRSGGVTHMPNAFMAAVRAGKGSASHIGIFHRVGKGRLKIIERRVITVASMFGKPAVQAAATKTINNTFSRRFNHHIDRLMQK